MADQKTNRIFKANDDEMVGVEMLAELMDVSLGSVMRDCMPSLPVAALFKQLLQLDPTTEATWAWCVENGTRNIINDLLAQAKEQHWQRLGLTSSTASPTNIEGATKKILTELKGANINSVQLGKAEQDTVYLGFLFEAHKKAQMHEAGYECRRDENGTLTIYKDGVTL